MAKDNDIKFRVDDATKKLLDDIIEREQTSASEFLRQKIQSHEQEKMMFEVFEAEQKQLRLAKNSLKTLQASISRYESKELDILYDKLAGKEFEGKIIRDKSELWKIIISHFSFAIQSDEMIVVPTPVNFIQPKEKPFSTFWVKIGIVAALLFCISVLGLLIGKMTRNRRGEMPY